MTSAATRARPGLNASSEEDLARRVQSGCADAMTELDRRMRPRLMAVLYRRVRDHATREDLAQQALFTAFRQVHRYDDRWRFSTWLFTIALRLASDEARKRRRELRRMTGAAAQRPARPADPAPGPLQLTLAEEVKRNLWATADRVLGETEFTVVWLRFGEGLEPDEVARAVGKTRLHVRVIQHRALSKLRKALQAEAEGASGEDGADHA
jgi:RNA polymerase sigma-70 factor (ECF subfamily)